jgi:hypothetical protein
MAARISSATDPATAAIGVMKTSAREGRRRPPHALGDDALRPRTGGRTQQRELHAKLVQRRREVVDRGALGALDAIGAAVAGYYEIDRPIVEMEAPVR